MHAENLLCDRLRRAASAIDGRLGPMPGPFMDQLADLLRETADFLSRKGGQGE